MVLFYFVGDVEEWVLDRMLNLVYKYKLVRKDKVGFMLNYIWWIFRDYLWEFMKRLVFFFYDEKYIWDDIYIGN